MVLSRPGRSGGDGPGVEAIGGCVYKRRALNTRLSSVTSAGNFCVSRGALQKCRGEASTKNEPNWYFVPVQKKGSESRSSRFEPDFVDFFFKRFESTLKTNKQTNLNKSQPTNIVLWGLVGYMPTNVVNSLSPLSGCHAVRFCPRTSSRRRMGVTINSPTKGRVEVVQLNCCDTTINWKYPFLTGPEGGSNLILVNEYTCPSRIKWYVYVVKNCATYLCRITFIQRIFVVEILMLYKHIMSFKVIYVIQHNMSLTKPLRGGEYDDRDLNVRMFKV